MKIICLGDSLTEGDYGIFGMRGRGDIRAENYPYFLGKILGVSVENRGKCGYRSSTYLDYYKAGNVSVKGADVILVMLGTNGGMDPDADTPDNAAYLELLQRLQTDEPNAAVVLCTPPHATENPTWSNYGYAPQVKQAVLFVRKLAREKGLPLVDLALCPDFTAENETVMQPNDGLHYGKVGYQTMARFIADRLKELKIL